MIFISDVAAWRILRWNCIAIVIWNQMYLSIFGAYDSWSYRTKVDKESFTFCLFKLTGYCQGENTAVVYVIYVILVFSFLELNWEIHIFGERERERE